MVGIPEYTDPTLQAVDAELERRANNATLRPYLGISSIGRSCLRNLWYSFHWATIPRFDAATLKRFADGFAGEDLQAKRLRMVEGVELYTVDPQSGQQFGVSDFGGHLQGHLDGAIRGLKQAPATYHVWEHKQTDEKKQAKLTKLKQEHGEKSALAQWDKVYYAQAVMYMHYTGIKRHYLTCSTPGGRSTVSCRTAEDLETAEKLRAKAQRVIFAPAPLERISERPDWYECNWCEHKLICHHKRVPEVNCRTCAHSTARESGDWYCEAYGKILEKARQEQGCEDHLFNPHLIPYAEMNSADSESVPQWVEYKHENGVTFYNITRRQTQAIHQNAYYSSELHHAEPGIIGDESANEIRQTFDAEIAG